MSTSSDERNPVELLAEDFLDRKRRGEQPTLREYAERHPELADEIRDLFPALLMIENLDESSGATTGSLAGDNGAAASIRLERLGDYRILREIGRGGMGVVYEAEQESLGRRVALKVLSAGSLLDPKQVRRFEREARAAAKLHHTNIVPVFGVGCQNGHHYFVMQFITGLGLDVVLEDLRRLRRSKSESGCAPGSAPAKPDIAGLSAVDVAHSLIAGRSAAPAPLADASLTEPMSDAAPPVDSPQADSGSSSALLPGSSDLSVSSDPDRQFYRSVARIGIQVAEALDYANRQGILHRDVKPSNLLLDNHGNTWVADFGLAKTAEADDLTHTGDILGTIRYMAPERFAGHCDARSDVYSLGLTLYELVALKPAYEASDRHSLIERVLHQDPERLKKLAPGVPRDLETIVAKAMSRDPAGRYATAAALADDLRRFVEDRPIRARRISPAERLARWCRRNPWIAASLALTAMALVAVAGMALLHARRQAEANLRITQLAGNLEKESIALKNERGRLKTALSESKSRLAALNLERGQAAVEKGQVGVGMLWTVESLKLAAEAGDSAAQHVALANLSAWRRHHVEPQALFPHGRTVASVAFSPDGKTILTASHDKTARLWDVATGAAVGQPIVHPNFVSFAAFSPDGKTILTGCEDNTARLWDAATGRPLGQPLPHSGWVWSVAFGPDGKTVLTGSHDSTARLWDVATGSPLGEPLRHATQVESVAFAPDGKTILTGSFDKTARLWDAATGRPLGRPLTHSDGVWSVAFSPDGKTILTGGVDRSARLWDAVTGRSIGQPLRHSDMVRAVAFSPDGKTILTGSSDNTAQMWDAATGARMGRRLEHQAAVWSVAFSPDGRLILTGCQDGMARLWEGDVGEPVGRPLDHANLGTSVAFAPDGKTLKFGGSDGQVRLWDVASGHSFGPPVELGPDILAMALSPDGRKILTGSFDKTARLWDAATGRPEGPVMQHSGIVSCVAFSSDGKTILSGGDDNLARLWDATTGLPVGQPLAHPGAVRAVAFSPDGKTILTGCYDRIARQWDAATGQPFGPTLEHWGTVNSVAFSPDGKTILTGSNDRTARLWDATSGLPIGHPLANSTAVSSVAFSPDGKTILTGCTDKTARLWDVATGEPIGAPMSHSATRAGWLVVAFSPDGRFLLTSDESAARRWEAPATLHGDLRRLAAWVEAATGLEMGERGSIRVLDRSAWIERRRRLEQLGGPPTPDPAPRLDPILFGSDPSARGEGWTERGRWDKAEAAYAEAIRARPQSRSVWTALARAHAERGHLEQAAATLADAVRMMPDDPQLRLDLGRALLWSGDWAGWRTCNAALLDRFGATNNAMTADAVALACVLGPAGTALAEAPIRLAEAAFTQDEAIARGGWPTPNGYYLSTFGAALYRAGRFDDAIRRLDEGVRQKGGQSYDWAFLAMAHHRLGHHADARQWLERLRDQEPITDPTRFWIELENRLLRNEAEALILYDPIFPADPFAK